jgi:hypothetical protein
VSPTIATANKVTEAAVVVPVPENQNVLASRGIGPQSRVIYEMQMRSSSRGIPDPLEPWENVGNHQLKPEGWWLTERAAFAGRASQINSYGELSAPGVVNVDNATAAFCVTKDGRLLGIVWPNKQSESSVWVGAACSRVKLLPKAGGMALTGDGWSIQLGDVNRLYRSLKEPNHRVAKAVASAAALAAADILILPSGNKSGAEMSGRYQTGQTQSFANAIAAGTQAPPSYDPVTPDGPPLGQGYRWLQVQSLGGIYRLERKGELTTATFLVDRELPKEEQLTALDRIDWAPPDMVEWVRKRVDDGALPKLRRPDLPPGRVSQPFLLNSLGRNVGDESAAHPVVRYMWPSLSNGQLSLDSDEQILYEYRCERSKLSAPSSASQAYSAAEIGSGKTTNTRVFITNGRVVVVATRSPEEIADGDKRRWWVSHFRHEWIYEAGTEEKTTFQAKMFTLKPKPGTEKNESSPFIRMHQVNSVHELVFPGLADPSFVSNVVSAVIAADSSRTVSDDKAHYEKGSFRVSRTVKRISNPIPYSLPLDLHPSRDGVEPTSSRGAEVQSDAGVVTLECPLCKRRLDDPQKMALHIQNFHAGESRSGSALLTAPGTFFQPDPQVGKDSLVCPKCKRRLDDPKKMALHIQNFHAGER